MLGGDDLKSQPLGVSVLAGFVRRVEINSSTGELPRLNYIVQ